MPELTTDLRASSNESQPNKGDSPLVFISHDSRDAQLAECFSKLLSSVSAGVLKSFRSTDRQGGQGIEYGSEWYPWIMDRLDHSSDVVSLLTRNSLARPWILFEAGIAKAKLNKVYGVALGIPLKDANTGPFAQFQNCDDDPESLTTLVIQLLKQIPGAEPDREVILSQVDKFKTKVTSILDAAPVDCRQVATLEDVSTAKLFEEIKVMFTDLRQLFERREGLRMPVEHFKSKTTEQFSTRAFRVAKVRLLREVISTVVPGLKAIHGPEVPATAVIAAVLDYLDHVGITELRDEGEELEEMIVEAIKLNALAKAPESSSSSGQ